MLINYFKYLVLEKSAEATEIVVVVCDNFCVIVVIIVHVCI